MAPFDNPALAAANVRVGQVNARGGVKGRPLKIVTCDTQGNKPAIASACAAKLIGQGVDVIFTTCDVDFAAPVVQKAINAGKLTIAPCIGTDQMGPKRFGPKGQLAFSFGNVAQDEGSAMAQYARAKGWKSAALATDTVIVYFKDVVKAFKARFTQLGGKIVAEESYQSLGSTSQQNLVTKLDGAKADVIVTATAGSFGALPQIVSGLRTLGNNTPILNSWAGDGTYWVTKDPQVTDYYYVTFASAFGDDPNPAVNALAKKLGKATLRDRWLRHRPGRDRRRRHGDQPCRRLDERCRARGAAREVQEGADAVGPRELLAAAAHGVRPAVSRDQDPEQQREGRRQRRRQGRSEDLEPAWPELEQHPHDRRRPGGALRAADVSRSFEGVHALQGVSLELHRHEVVGLDRPERCREVDARQPPQWLRLPVRRLDRARWSDDHPLERPSARAATALPGRFSTAMRFARSPCGRTSR